MSNPANQIDVHTPFDLGQVLQVPLTTTAINLATTVPASDSVISDLIQVNGYKALAFGCNSSQNGSVSIQRYLDQAGLIPQGAALTVSLTGGTAAVLNNSDNHPFQSMKITVSNSGGSNATLTNTLLLLQSN